MINAAGRMKVERHVKDALEKGGKLLMGGKSPGGNFWEPTLIVGANTEMECFKEEQFGPLLAIASFDTEEEAITIANDCEVGLAGYFCSKDLDRVCELLKHWKLVWSAVSKNAVSLVLYSFFL